MRTVESEECGRSSRPPAHWFGLFCIAFAACACDSAPRSVLPPVPAPPENPVTESKRVLGKVLFWDEQLSANDTVACGTCHRPGQGGADPRSGLNPGASPDTIDDVTGSPGIVSLDENGAPVAHTVFGFGPQVTARLSPSNFGALWSPELFWDGRAGSEVVDPRTGETVIESGGALENQVLETLANPAEMAKTGQTWDELTAKLGSVRPLGLASAFPADVAKALRDEPGYPALFAAAFGDPAITPVRIAFAIASYERTLVADQAPWDRFRAGDEDAMTPAEQSGWRSFQDFHCNACHEPPLFTNHGYFNIGLRGVAPDPGRRLVSGEPSDTGAVKVPSLRNVGLRLRFMHTGEFRNLNAALRSYINSIPSPDRDDIPGAGPYSFNFDIVTQGNLQAFLETALTDPRVRDEEFPFDRPTLGSERKAE